MPSSFTAADLESYDGQGEEATNGNSANGNGADDNGFDEDSQGIDETQTVTQNSEGSQNADSNVAVEVVESNELLSQIAEQNTVIATLSLALVVAVFLCFGALCVQTLLRALEFRK